MSLDDLHRLRRQKAEIEKAIQEKEQNLKELNRLKIEEEKKNFVPTPLMRLASSLHKQMCRHNHTDGCGWHYSNWATHTIERRESSHQQYLNMAAFMVQNFEYLLANDKLDRDPSDIILEIIGFVVPDMEKE